MTNNMKRLLKGSAVLCEMMAAIFFLWSEPKLFLFEIVYPSAVFVFCSWFIGVFFHDTPLKW